MPGLRNIGVKLNPTFTPRLAFVKLDPRAQKFGWSKNVWSKYPWQENDNEKVMGRNRVLLLIITFYLIFNVSVAILKYLYVFIVTLMVAAQSLEGGGPVGGREIP